MSVSSTSGADFADALAGVPVAARSDAPILLVTPDGVPAATAEALDRLAPATVVVLGGEAAVGQQVMTELEALRADWG